MGILDDVLRDIVSDVTGILVDALWTFKNVSDGYDWTTGTESSSTTTKTARAVRKNFSESLIDGTRVKTGDFRLVVAAKDLDTALTIESTQMVVLPPSGSPEYSVQDIRKIGIDLNAVYIFHLRGPEAEV